MESTSTIIGVIIAFIVILPIVLIQKSQTSKKKKTRKGFLDEASKHQLNITESDFWGTYYAIALDKNKNQLIYSKEIDSHRKTIVVDLNKVASCEIVRTSRRFKSNKVYKSETDKIELVIEYKNNKKAKEILEFYNVDINIEMNNEVALLEKWKTKIDGFILTKSNAA